MTLIKMSEIHAIYDRQSLSDFVVSPLQIHSRFLSQFETMNEFYLSHNIYLPVS